MKTEFDRDYDPFIVAAANRRMVRLKDGRSGRLIWWDAKSENATIYRDGKHISVTKEQIDFIIEGNL